MALNITAGYTLSANDSTPGVLNYHILSAALAGVTEDTTGVTAFNSSGTWHKFECADAEGDWTAPATAGSGGKEFVLAANYRIGGLSEAKLELFDDVIESSRLIIVAEHRDGRYYLLTRNGATASTGTIGSGVGGGGAAAVGSTLTFVAQDSVKPTQVVVTTTLDAITASA